MIFRTCASWSSVRCALCSSTGSSMPGPPSPPGPIIIGPGPMPNRGCACTVAKPSVVAAIAIAMIVRFFIEPPSRPIEEKGQLVVIVQGRNLAGRLLARRGRLGCGEERVGELLADRAHVARALRRPAAPQPAGGDRQQDGRGDGAHRAPASGSYVGRHRRRI